MVLLCCFTQPLDPSYFEAFITFNFSQISMKLVEKRTCNALCKPVVKWSALPLEQTDNAVYYLKELDIDLE